MLTNEVSRTARRHRFMEEAGSHGEILYLCIQTLDHISAHWILHLIIKFIYFGQLTNFSVMYGKENGKSETTLYRAGQGAPHD
jgi:hypothetical protein